MERANNDLRKAARCAKVPFWAIAAELGISEPTMSRRLRQELSEGQKRKIMSIIASLAKQEAEENEQNAGH